MTASRGTTGVVAPDGSPVEIYRALPRPGEADMIHAAIPAGASVLDLGCGTGRFARALAALEHTVVAVDHEPAMLDGLETVAGITTVLDDVGSLSQERTFDVVLLASHLVNDDELGPRVLAVASDHLAPRGAVIGEVYPPTIDWPASVGRRSALGPVGVTVTRATVDGDRLTASVRYDLGEHTWDQPFTARLLDQAALVGRLARSDLAFDRWLDAGRGWFLARRQVPGSTSSISTTRADQGQ